MSLLEECAIDCPYCGESITVLVDISVSEQSYVEDCEVCCQPMIVNVIIDENNLINVYAQREDE